MPTLRRSTTLLTLMLSFPALPRAERPRDPLVAVMPLVGKNVDSASAQIVSEALSNLLVKTGKLRVMERSQMSKVLAEQGFQQSGGCDGSECAVEIGKLLSIDRMVVGTLGKLGVSYSISVRMVDIQSGEVLGSSQKMQRGEIDEVVSGLLPSVASELVRTSSPPDGGPPASAAKDTAGGSRPSHDSNLIWWLAGGAVVAGGATAAILLLSRDDTPARPPVAAGSTTDVQVRWAD